MNGTESWDRVLMRGFTRHASSGVAEQTRGTFAGLIEKIPYLQHLGITARENRTLGIREGRGFGAAFSWPTRSHAYAAPPPSL